MLMYWCVTCDYLGHYDPTGNDSQRCSKDNSNYAGVEDFGYSTVCQLDYKFSSNMENTASFGYTSEKLATGLVADTVPIYFGNKEVTDFVNEVTLVRLARHVWRYSFCDCPGQPIKN